MKKYTIAVVGGTGKSGNYLVQHLLEKGYPIRLLLRHPEHFKMQHPSIEVIKGDARDKESICSLIKGCEVIISTLGQPKGEKSIFSDATGNIIVSMNELGIKRYIVTTGLSVNTEDDCKNIHVKTATEWMYQNYPETTADKQKEYHLLAKGNVDWTLVRLPLIDLTYERFAIEANLTDCKGEKISAADLAEFLISQIEDTAYIRKSPFLYNV
ncbi:NAD-dependent epimerase/dehydratase family protein [Chryseobacterium indologenes]|uniref:NAD-dependent epimerase/dehydratase family protein n=1 Tax=Chryseobacterium indologenes TaxID=253 RepID=A0AAD0YQV9_CHRID|nr:NAD(P)H-binding protein [Chryseobacterium indologenes]AZB16665.1 NAD-dependent epimerase/dehydratase family protein [Chryseobacterium indologenes]